MHASGASRPVAGYSFEITMVPVALFGPGAYVTVIVLASSVMLKAIFGSGTSPVVQ